MSYTVAELSSAIANYHTYRDMGAVDDMQTVTDPKEVWNSVASSLQNEKVGAENEAMLKKLLRQPVMADIYADNGISPRDVPTYIDSVLKGSESSKRAILSSLAQAYQEASESHKREARPVVDGVRELYSLRAHISKDRPNKQPAQIISSMNQFVASRQPAEPEKKKRMVKLKEGVGRWFGEAIKKVTLSASAITAVVITSGVADNTKLSPEGQKLIDKELAKDNTKANDANTLQLVAKNTQHQA
ncbi:MAG: hypothetical protein IKR92_04485 [Alphaproteobacteria bacterium]|nr:hypothetical protein [Alphaproteobacteria bacterium]